MNRKKFTNRKIVVSAMLGAITVILGMTPLGFIPLGFLNTTTLHIPVIIGAIIEGPIVEDWLGLFLVFLHYLELLQLQLQFHHCFIIQ